MPSERIDSFDLSIQRVLVDLETRLPPWMKLISQSDESAFARLSREITAFAELVSPTPKERLVRIDIINRLQLHVCAIWPFATVVPIGSYAQMLYTSDMDLFISLPDTVESLDNLELLYRSLESSSLPASGTLSIVRTARVPIVKYTDSRGSGIQVDISMNNISATASTQFVQHHLLQSPILRPLTMVLKQWLFQRKMNEVYTRGGLSSYALFLLVFTVLYEHSFEVEHPEEAIGKYLVQFLQQWSDPNAFASLIHPIHGHAQKPILNWEDAHQPFSLCMLHREPADEGIQDPVNEMNFIGRQTFSIREIQQEWELSLNALKVALEEYHMDINGGRQRSLLASIVGLSTREFESRKQISSMRIREPTIATTKKASPPLQLHPEPPKRIKFRNMLTRGGGLIGNEEVEKIIEKNRRCTEPPELSTEQQTMSGATEPFNFKQLSRPPAKVQQGFELLSFGLEDPLETASSQLIPNPTSTSSLSPKLHSFSPNIASSLSTLSISSSPGKLQGTEIHPHIENSGTPFASYLPLKKNAAPLLDLDAMPELHGEFSEPRLSFQSSTLDDLSDLRFDLPLAELSAGAVCIADDMEESDSGDEAIVFQGSDSHRPTSDSSAIKLKPVAIVDPEVVDRAFRVFSQGLKLRRP